MSKSIILYLSEGPMEYAKRVGLAAALGAGTSFVGNKISGEDKYDVKGSAAATAAVAGALGIGSLFDKTTNVVQKIDKTPSSKSKDVPKGKKQDIIKNT